VDALVALDLEVGPGELLVVVGPSGSGKSTALRLVAGLEQPTEGRVLLGDRDVTSLAPGDRDVAMIFQSYALFPHLTVEQNIGFGLRARRVERGEARRRVEEAAAVVGCGPLLRRRPAELSGGERQRVALARALVREPKAFLLDEPLSNLDAQLRVEMRAELKRLQQRLGATMLYVTHDQSEALMLGDRIAVLGAGRLHQVGSPSDIYRRPANRFVATFVGTPAMNVYDVVDGRAGPFMLEGKTADRRLEAGIRPEHVTLGGDVAAEVQLVEEAGSETYLHLVADGQTIVARVAPDVRASPGDRLPIGVRPKHIYLFDAETGEAVR
jgi:multiple sugar transport system ATP-binding protein